LKERNRKKTFRPFLSQDEGDTDQRRGEGGGKLRLVDEGGGGLGVTRRSEREGQLFKEFIKGEEGKGRRKQFISPFNCSYSPRRDGLRKGGEQSWSSQKGERKEFPHLTFSHYLRSGKEMTVLCSKKRKGKGSGIYFSNSCPKKWNETRGLIN